MLAHTVRRIVDSMKRRSLLGMACWLLSKPALSQSHKPAIGFMSSRSARDSAYLLPAFGHGLAEGGFIEGENVTVHYRWADGHYDRLPALAADLVNRRIELLVAVGGEPSALAAKAAAGSTLPLVFTAGGDPVKAGLVASLSRPGANATGVSLMTTTPEAKRMEFLNDLVPSATAVAALVDPAYADAPNQERALTDAARVLSKELRILRARDESELGQAFDTLINQPPSGLVVASDPFFDTQRDRILAFAARQRLPAIYQFRDYAVAGGLMSYGVSLTEGYRLVGVYAAKILRGAKPSELPVQQSVKFELVINAATARMLGLEVPQALLARADEVIE